MAGSFTGVVSLAADHEPHYATRQWSRRTDTQSIRLNSVLKTRRPSAFRGWSPYPENDILDFNVRNPAPEIAGDYFVGGFLRLLVRRQATKKSGQRAKV